MKLKREIPRRPYASISNENQGKVKAQIRINANQNLENETKNEHSARFRNLIERRAFEKTAQFNSKN